METFQRNGNFPAEQVHMVVSSESARFFQRSMVRVLLLIPLNDLTERLIHHSDFRLFSVVIYPTSRVGIDPGHARGKILVRTL